MDFLLAPGGISLSMRTSRSRLLTRTYRLFAFGEAHDVVDDDVTPSRTGIPQPRFTSHSVVFIKRILITSCITWKPEINSLLTC